jgi:phospholipase C
MSPPMDRRDFLKHAGMIGAGLGAGVLAGCSDSTVITAPASQLRALPDPGDSGIDHIVVVMMENRSFDHMLGWVPGADGRQAGLRYRDKAGVMQDTHRLSPDFQGCGLEDPPHGYDAGRVHLNDGRMDGFLQNAEPGDVFPIGYYTAEDLPFFAGCAEHWTICDRYHSGMLASTQSNRMYMHCGQSDRSNNSGGLFGVVPMLSSLPTIWDAAREAGVRTGYYFNNLPYTAIWGAKYLGFSRPFASLAVEAAAGLLPNITYIDPFFYQDGLDHLCNDDHPHADVRNGQRFLNTIYNILRRAPTWERTLLVINYDEWGGFYDHVTPPFMPISEQEATETGNDGRLGIRVPCVLAGPRVRKGHVEHLLFEPNSILKFMEWRWNLQPLGVRSAVTNNLAHALDFDAPPRSDAPSFDVPINLLQSNICALPGQSATLSKSMQDHAREIVAMQTLARQQGFNW